MTSRPCPAWTRRYPDALPVLDLDALERNIKKMGDYAKAHGMRHRVHGKMHKSVDVAKLQVELGGACGVCCQKVSEAEVFARGGIKDVLVSNQVRDPPRSTAWRACRSSARARSAASTTSTTWPTCRRRRRSTAPRSSASSRSTAARAAAV
jgi:D-serine deaminase-like pyridoxal phosphate-dependent protein